MAEWQKDHAATPRVCAAARSARVPQQVATVSLLPGIVARYA